MLPPASAYAATAQLLRYGSRGADVADLQRKLNTLGYSCGPVDGVFGSRTRSAVMAFQRAHHLQVDGIVDAATLSELAKALAHSNSSKSGSNSSSSSGGDARTKTPASAPKYPGKPLAIGSSGSNVTLVQQQLNKLGYNCGTPDGVYGNQTAAAVRAFQRDHHVNVDGVVNAQTWTLLFSQPSRQPSQGGSTTTTTYTAYDVYNHQIAGPFTKQADAINALVKTNNGSPGGYVKDSSGHVVYRQPYFAAYDRNNNLLGTYLTESAAKAKVTGLPGGYVKTLDGTRLDVQPDYAVFNNGPGTPSRADYVSLNTALQHASTNSFVVDMLTRKIEAMNQYYFERDGKWYMHVGSAEVMLANHAPSFAQDNVLYYAKSVDPNHSPFNTDFYVLSKKYTVDPNTNTKTWYFDGSHVGQWENPLRKANLVSEASVTADELDNWLKSQHDALWGLGASFVDAQEAYGVNATFLMSHAILESGHGKSNIALTKNNIFGYGAYDYDPGNLAGIYPSEDYAIHYQAYVVRQGYLDPGGYFYMPSQGPTLDGMNEHYATDEDWSAKIAAIEDKFLADQGNKPFSTKDNADVSLAPSQPIYLTNGAMGEWVSSTYVANGHSMAYSPQTYPGLLKIGSKGTAVLALQTMLNIVSNANLTVDGDFGPMTQAAVSNYQQANHLTPTGQVDQATWNSLWNQLPKTFSVDKMRMGFVLGRVTSQCHIIYTLTGTNQQASAWVDGRFIHLTNVMRVVPKAAPGSNAYADLAKIPVYADANHSQQIGYIHAGDYVVTKDNSGHVYYSVQNGRNAQLMDGYVDLNTYKLVPYDLAPNQW
jgi:peptidoglycan hydrolase-like protein with peptidoglycan-binding domain/beta-N-acetylglucosaminidase